MLFSLSIVDVCFVEHILIMMFFPEFDDTHNKFEAARQWRFKCSCFLNYLAACYLFLNGILFNVGFYIFSGICSFDTLNFVQSVDISVGHFFKIFVMLSSSPFFSVPASLFLKHLNRFYSIKISLQFLLELLLPQ